MKTSLAILLGLASAVTLPPYWDGEYSNTWMHADRPHIVNEVEWKEGDPDGYKEAVWGSSLVQVSDVVSNNNYPADKTPVSTLEEMSPEFRDAWNHDQDEYTNHAVYKKDTPKNYVRLQVGDVVLFAEKEKQKETKYDHLHEQHSVVVPYVN